MQRYIKLSIYAACKFLGIFALLRLVNARSLVILCYHAGALGDEWKYNPKLFIRRKHFERRITWLLDKGYRVISLDDACRLPPTRWPDRAVVITFDDGWASTCIELIPILASRMIPAAIYLSTSNFLGGVPIVEVAIRYIVFNRNCDLIAVHNLLGGTIRHYDVTSQAQVERLIVDFKEWIDCRVANRDEVYSKLEELAMVLGLEAARLNMRSRRFDYATSAELQSCQQSGCAIELHGHRHRYPAGAPGEFDTDLAICEETIVRLGFPVPRHFCYPSGKHDEGAARVLADHAITSATTCLPGSIDEVSDANRYYLPRFVDGEDVHFLEFEAELSGAASLARKWLGRKQSDSLQH